MHLTSTLTYKYSTAATTFYFNNSIKKLKELAQPSTTVLLIDEHVWAMHANKFKGWKTIAVPSGEQHKNQDTINDLVEKLISLEVDRKWTIVGIGGGVVTDLTGYLASVYMRGIRFGFVPTSLLGLVDASIGGKNGVDVGIYKNIVGVINQPAFLLHDLTLLQTLPDAEWRNGFAEIIKHACIKDAKMFEQLQLHDLYSYQKKRSLLAELVARNAKLKADVVKKDEFEKDERRLLNFGHTLGHAIENKNNLSHGQAISIGMIYACELSFKLTGFKKTIEVSELLKRYELPVSYPFNMTEALNVLKMDKKRVRDEMNYVLLEKPGKAIIKSIPLKQLDGLLRAAHKKI